MTITLPLPYKALSPNVRCHYMTKAKRVKLYRQIARLRTLEALQGKPAAFSSYTLRFYFKTKQRRDDDNAGASFKSGRDGIADALRMDDHGLVMAATPELLHDSTNPRLEVTLHP